MIQIDNEEVFALIINSQIEPSFSEDIPVLLQKEYAEVNPFCCRYLKKGVSCVIIRCGLSRYLIDKKSGEFGPVSDGVEWCHVAAKTHRVEPLNDNDCVKVTDLKLATLKFGNTPEPENDVGPFL